MTSLNKVGYLKESRCVCGGEIYWWYFEDPPEGTSPYGSVCQTCHAEHGEETTIEFLEKEKSVSEILIRDPRR